MEPDYNLLISVHVLMLVAGILAYIAMESTLLSDQNNDKDPE